jgi:hypothetical protein
VPDRRVLKRPLKVTFVGEPGIDEGGLRKELFILLSRQVRRNRKRCRFGGGDGSVGY